MLLSVGNELIAVDHHHECTVTIIYEISFTNLYCKVLLTFDNGGHFINLHER